jgi:hypothetical protein
MVVPFAAGGPTDTIGRVVAEGMRASLGQPIIIENVTGAAGSIGVGRVARAAADGYTISIGQWGCHVTNGAIYALPYDLINDFAPVAWIATGTPLVVSRNTLPAKNLRELLAWLKANPEKATQGTAGAGSPQHIAGIYFQKETATRFQFVPYRGWTPSPVCIPARASFATGKYIHQIGFWDNADPYDGSVPSWHHRLREAGHQVVSIGKLHFRSDEDDCGFSESIIPMQVFEGKGDLLGLIR